jgi:L-alanine-DL-glutamate epimerase-like enolase superfamily enzyme
MNIDRIELFHVTIPLAKPFHPAWIPGYPQTANRFTLARLTTDDGLKGLAAGLAFEREREGLGSLLGPYLIGLDPTDIDTGRQRIRELPGLAQLLAGSRVLGYQGPGGRQAGLAVAGWRDGGPGSGLCIYGRSTRPGAKG